MYFFQFDDAKPLRRIINFIIQIIVVVALAYFLVYAYGSVVTCYGQSMQPAIEADEKALINRITYKFSNPKRYDVVVFDTDSTTDNIKRVIGLPGEIVKIDTGKVYINGEMLDSTEGYADVSLAGIASQDITLGADEYFVLGDNRDASEDSRFETIGNISRSDIKGKLWMRISPLIRIGFVR